MASVPVVAQPGPDGIDWVTITNPNNPTYSGPDELGIVTGRGSVGYDYRIGRTEITTAQYLEFYNAFHARVDPAPITMIWRPSIWGAVLDSSYEGPGTRYRLINEAAANRPVGGIDWRSAARLANWLHNDKGTDYADIANGAYDTSTFGFDSLGRFTDQVTHNPDAKYWIPTLDEYIKAAYWSPTNPNGDGWFVQPLGRDTPAQYGPPPGFPNGNPLNEANAGFSIGQAGHWAIPLGSYPHAQSPWGLLDLAGGASEFVEQVFWSSGLNYRLFHGSFAGVTNPTGYDRIDDGYGGAYPDSVSHYFGIRLASSVPGPNSIITLAVLVVFGVRCGRRRGRHQGVTSCARLPLPWPALVHTTSSVVPIEACMSPSVCHRFMTVFVAGLLSGPMAASVFAQPGPDGIDWVTITNPNNPAYSGPDDIGIATGRGSVGYDYRIARTEITTALYLEFYNAFQARIDPAPITMIWRPAVWGATIDTSYTGPGTRYRLINEAAANRPVGGIDWRSLARLSNWLHNDKGSDYADISNGAYDTSTFGYDSLGRFTDQVSHNPGAKYWIPTLDEYMKAAFWSPTNPNRDGWFVQPLGRDTPALYGPPPGWPNGDPANEANANFMIGQAGHWGIPLGSYPHAQSPWGLLDVSGGTMEWLEEEYWVNDHNLRLLRGSFAGGFGAAGYDRIDSFGSDYPDSVAHFFGGRLASAIPSPFSGLPLAIAGVLVVASHRRRGPRQGVLSCAHARPSSPASHS